MLALLSPLGVSGYCVFGGLCVLLALLGRWSLVRLVSRFSFVWFLCVRGVGACRVVVSCRGAVPVFLHREIFDATVLFPSICRRQLTLSHHDRHRRSAGGGSGYVAVCDAISRRLVNRLPFRLPLSPALWLLRVAVVWFG